MTPLPPPTSSQSNPRLLTVLRLQLRLGHYSLRTEQAYVSWVRRFVRFHRCRHPRELDEREVVAFLRALVDERHVSASTQAQALAALLFLYREVLGRPLQMAGLVLRGLGVTRIPVVLDRAEVSRVLAQLPGVYHLVGLLLYGSGLRLLECLTLRIKDVDLGRSEIRVRRGKGQKDRVTMVPEAAREPLRDHLERVRARHEADLAAGAGAVVLPEALARKYPGAIHSWVWQVGLPGDAAICGPGDRGGAAAPSAPLGGAAGDDAGGAAVGDRQAGQLSYLAALLRDPSIGGGIRHPDGAGAAGAPGREDDDDLHPRVAAGGPRSSQPGGPIAGRGLRSLQVFPFTAPWRCIDDARGQSNYKLGRDDFPGRPASRHFKSQASEHGCEF
jgi:hypothetical protein